MLWERYFGMGGDVPHHVRNAQHYKYGPVVRTGPNAVSIADPELTLEILVKKDYPKVRFIDLSRCPVRYADGPCRP